MHPIHNIKCPINKTLMNLARLSEIWEILNRNDDSCESIIIECNKPL